MKESGLARTAMLPKVCTCASCYINLPLHPKTPAFPNDTKVFLVPETADVAKGEWKTPPPKEVVALNVLLHLVILLIPIQQPRALVSGSLING